MTQPLHHASDSVTGQPGAQAGQPDRGDLSDMRPDDWVDRWLPRAWGPYARLCRLDRPIGIWLTLPPTLAALVQAAGGIPDWWRLIIFTLGAVLMRGLGCTINDIWDRDFDHRVERTRFRPLTSGQVTLRAAIVFLVAQLLVCALLLFAVNGYSRWLALALVPIVMVYPLCKRFTYWPQVVLGIGFNWGMLMAWSDTQNVVPLAAVAMWWGAVMWQVGYDSIYAYIDVRDDQALGLHSTALRFGARGKAWISGFYLVTVALWWIGGHGLGMAWPYFAVLAVIAAHFLWQMRVFDVTRPERGLRLFHSNKLVGVLFVAATLVGTLAVDATF